MMQFAKRPEEGKQRFQEKAATHVSSLSGLENEDGAPDFRAPAFCSNDRG